MMLVERHMNPNQENRQGIRRYLEAFVSLVKQGKIKPTRRGFLLTNQTEHWSYITHSHQEILKVRESQSTFIYLRVELGSGEC